MSDRSLEDELHRLLELFEKKPQGRFFAPLADCYRKLGRLEEAYRLCVDGLTRHPQYSTGFVILGKIHLDRGEEKEATTAFETVLSMDPENLVALQGLAELAQRAGEEEKAREYTAQLEQLDPLKRRDGEEPSTVEEPKPSPEGGAEKTEVAAEAKKKGAEETEAAGETESSESGKATQEAEVLVANQAEIPARETEVLTALSQDDSLQNAADDFDPEGIFEGQTIVTVTLADVYYEQGFKAKALEMYRKVLQRHPDAPGVAGKVEAIERELSDLAERVHHVGAQAVEERLENLESPPGDSSSPSGKEESESGNSHREEAPGTAEPDSSPKTTHFQEWVKKRRKD